MAEIKIAPITEQLRQLGLMPNGDMQVFVTELARQYMNQYVPTSGSDGRGLRASTRLVDNHTAIEYATPYSHYQYRGLLFVDPITLKGAFFKEGYGFWSRPGVDKIPDPEGRKLNYTNPKASSYWDKKMLKEDGPQFFNAIQEMFDRRYKK